MCFTLSNLIFFFNPKVPSTPSPFPNAGVRSSQNKFLLVHLCIPKFLNGMTHVTYSHNELCSGLFSMFSKSRLLSIITEPSDSLSPSPRPHGLPSQPHRVAPTPDLGLCSWCIKDNPGRSYSVNVEVFIGHLPCTTWQCAAENRQGESSLSLERKDTIQHWQSLAVCKGPSQMLPHLFVTTIIWNRALSPFYKQTLSPIQVTWWLRNWSSWWITLDFLMDSTRF